MDETQDAVPIHDEVAAEFGGVIAVRVEKLAALEPAFDVGPYYARMPGAQARAFQPVGFVHRPFAGERLVPFHVERLDYRNQERDQFYKRLERNGQKALEEFRKAFPSG